MSFKKWKEHFEANQHHMNSINWNERDHLTLKEKRLIDISIKQFQKGENSEGKHLIHYAKEYGDLTYLQTIKLFIREEQRHASVLGKFMDLHGITRIQSHWVDRVFRRLRTIGSSLENSVMVLITAEIIAAVYYQALRKSTASRILQSICQQLLIDEEMHINFQSFTLSKFYQARNGVGMIGTRTLHRLLMAGTTIVVWLHHSKVLRAGHYTFGTFYREVFMEFRRSEEMIIGQVPAHSAISQSA